MEIYSQDVQTNHDLLESQKCIDSDEEVQGATLADDEPEIRKFLRLISCYSERQCNQDLLDRIHHPALR